MKFMNKRTEKVISGTLVLLFSMASILMFFSFDSTISENIEEEVGEETPIEMKSPSPSILGDAPWWNRTFTYRKLINITNPYDTSFNDFIANITFNYANLVSNGKMNESLKDVRIVENGVLKEYYIEKDFPEQDLATIWFKTDVSVGQDETEYDTYMYYGYENASFASSYLMDNNPDGLIWYRFDNMVSGNIIVDIMGNHNATVNNGATISTESAVGKGSLSCDGTDDFLEIQNKNYDSPNILSALTVCVFFKTGFSSGSWTSNWAFFDYDRSEYFNFFIRPDNGYLGFSSTAKYWDESDPDTGFDSNSGDDYDDFYGTTDLNDDAWHFGAAVYDGEDKILYSDGGTQDGFIEDNRNVNAHQGYAMGGRRNANPRLRYGIIADGSEAEQQPARPKVSGNSPDLNDIHYQGLIDEIRYFEYNISAQRIEWLAKKYIKMDTKLNQEQVKRVSVMVIAKDVDGRIVPGLDVYLVNNTVSSHENYNGISDNLGVIDFPDINRSRYIITANYSISNGTHTFERVVFDSSDHNIIYSFKGGDFFTVYINVSLWSIDFEIEDVDEQAMGYGYVLVYNKSDYTDLIANITLDKEFGKATFRWINISDTDAKYYYKVYYDNVDYTPQHTLLKTGTVDRAAYLSAKINDTSFILVNQTNESEEPEKYRVEQKVYATGSDETHIGNTRIINATISLRRMNHTLTRVVIYPIDYNNTVITNPIYERPPPAYSIPQRYDIIEVNITEWGDVYGLLIVVEGDNSTLVGNCNGTIATSYSETCNVYEKTSMSKLRVLVYDTEGIWKSEWGSVRVDIVNGSTFEGITSLLTNAKGIAKGEVNTELEFWYLSGKEYNFSLTYGGDQRYFNDTVDLDSWVLSYDYTLTKNATLEFRIQTSISDFATRFQEIYSDTTKEWGQDFTFRVLFESTDNGGTNWDPVVDADFVEYEITDLLGDNVYDSGPMNSEAGGYFNYSFNSGFLMGGDQYYFKIYGEKAGYQNPTPLQLLFTVSEKTTSIGVYNTSNPSQNLGSNVTLYYGESISLTVFYVSGVLLDGATVTYEWQFTDNPTAISEAPTGYYSFTIDTSIADVGTYKIDLNAAKQNYSSQYFRFDIVIVHRPTSLNDDTSLHHIPKILWVRQEHNFTFEYKDILSEPHVNLNNLDEASYQWYEVSANGSIIGSISDEIDLIEGPNSTYVLDFSTGSREVGYYALFVTMQKNNYEVRTALIDLTIQKRLFTLDFEATNLQQNQIRIVQGTDVSLEIELTDLSDPSNPEAITGATVILTLGSQQYDLTDSDGDGIYTYTFTTDNIDTFFAQKVFSGDISISKEDYISTSIPITIVVGMTEIFPGFPMFYFLMIVGSAVAVVGSLATYRIVQQRRIPTFVKKARSMKKSIKGNKEISDSLLYPYKEEFIVKKLGDKWQSIGLSLADIMGVKEKKKMKLPEAKEEFKGGID